ncbi:MAG: glycosyltransferase [Proteobacteria bacterium]|nr:glycosyltransferase [Pseudomonadota bacterium]
MKILQIIHAFPPQSIGGSEIYTRNLALALAKKGAEVLVLTRVNNPAQKEYLTSSHSDDGFQVFAINNTFKYCTSFELTYKNQIINGIYAKLIDNWKPDLVHFEHLTCLSTTLVKETSRRKIPTVFTLHDYWLICQRGQLLKKDLSLCEGPNRENCYACLGEQLILGKSTKLLSTKIQKYNYFKKVLAKGAIRRLKTRAIKTFKAGIRWGPDSFQRNSYPH